MWRLPEAKRKLANKFNVAEEPSRVVSKVFQNIQGTPAFPNKKQTWKQDQVGNPKFVQVSHGKMGAFPEWKVR